MAYQSIQQEYMQIPTVTRTYTSCCLLTSVLVQLDIITPFQIYYNWHLIFHKLQVWRLVTNFMYFGNVSFNLLFNMLFAYRYCRMLEEGSFRGRTADFAFMFILGGAVMTVIGHIFKFAFLGHALTIMLVYVWSRRNPYVRLNFFGLLNFQAPYLPWVIIGFSLLLGNSISVDILGIAVGHIYYFLEDVFPNQQNGSKILKTPRFMVYYLDGIVEGEANGEEGYMWVPEHQDNPADPTAPPPQTPGEQDNNDNNARQE